MSVTAAYLRHLNSNEDLITPYPAIRAGFVALALERNVRATPVIEQARILKVTASQVNTPADLIDIKHLHSALLTAAGVSDKAKGHLAIENQREAIEGLITNFLEPAGSQFVEELVYRFLLTKGDTLGGSMRNVGGFLAQQKLSRSIIGSLTLAGRSYKWLHGTGKIWIEGDDNFVGNEQHMRGIAWSTIDQHRTLIYNLNVPLVRSNIDMCLLSCEPLSYNSFIHGPENYIALGELKGGIDPAGADEHWKTARTALSRIQDAFSAKGFIPVTFFVGAAIVNRMSKEIWELLENENNYLTNAANITNSDQTAALCQWLVSL